VVIVDAEERRVAWLALRDGSCQPVERSNVVDFGRAELGDRIDRPKCP
jgi:hypothetical protein